MPPFVGLSSDECFSNSWCSHPVRNSRYARRAAPRQRGLPAAAFGGKNRSPFVLGAGGGLRGRRGGHGLRLSVRVGACGGPAVRVPGEEEALLKGLLCQPLPGSAQFSLLSLENKHWLVCNSWKESSINSKESLLPSNTLPSAAWAFKRKVIWLTYLSPKESAHNSFFHFSVFLSCVKAGYGQPHKRGD